MPITGNDSVSVTILEELKKGTKIKDIPLLYAVSLDQAKRLSRYHNILQTAAKHLSRHAQEKIQLLGLRVLSLAALFKDEDWEALEEILSSIDAKTTRNELPLLMQAVKGKRKRIAEFMSEIGMKLKALEKRENELAALKREVHRKQERLDEKISFLKKYPMDIRLFLLKHLGIYENDLVLARRLDSAWQKSLKKKEVLTYDELNYVWYVTDLDQLAADYRKRIHQKRPFTTEWEYEKEVKRNQHGKYPVPDTPIIEAVEGEIRELEAEREVIMKEIKKLRKASPKSFMESIEAMNAVSAKALKLHGELQGKALKWLFRNEFVVSSEVLLPNGKRCDVIGYNENGQIVIIEVKVSKADFQQDGKWETYLDYCNEFYFLTTEEVSPLYYAKEKYKGIGLLEETKNGLRIREPFSREQQVKDKAKVQFAINKSLSRKLVFGY